MAEKPSLPEILEACIDRRLEGVHTACPGTIVSFSAGSQTATCRTRLPDTELLEDVPVCIPGDWSSGDPVLLVFCEREFGSDLSDAGEERRHGTSAAIAVPLIARSSSGVDFVALAGLVNDRLEKLQYAFDNHVHATAGTGTPSPPIPYPLAIPPAVVPVGSLDSVAASKVKAR